MSTYGQGNTKIFPQKTSMVLKPRIFSPANLSRSTVFSHLHMLLYMLIHLQASIFATVCIGNLKGGTDTLYANPLNIYLHIFPIP